jgi:uncharacterized protein YciI
MPRFLVLAMRQPGFDPSIGPAHHAYLDELRLAGKLEMTGPFADASGGAYLLLADDRAEAEALVAADPLAVSGLSLMTLYEWQAR